MNTPRWTRWALLAQCLLIIVLTGCFGAPVEEEPPQVNTPPHIAADFISPTPDVVRVESDQPVTLSVENLLDQGADDHLHYAVIGHRSGIIEQATASRRPTDERYREVFHFYEGVELDIDPCVQRLRDEDDELIRVHVTDRPFESVTEAGVEIAEDAYLTTHRWLLRFRPQICE